MTRLQDLRENGSHQVCPGVTLYMDSDEEITVGLLLPKAAAHNDFSLELMLLNLAQFVGISFLPLDVLRLLDEE